MNKATYAKDHGFQIRSVGSIGAGFPKQDIPVEIDLRGPLTHDYGVPFLVHRDLSMVKD